MRNRIGVYICKCGPNIEPYIDMAKLSQSIQALSGVVTVKAFGLLCANDGKTFLENEIRNKNLDRVVVAGCSPKEHEHTFKDVLQKAGLNPYLLQIANIREQCAWIIKDSDLATDHAFNIIRAAVTRVSKHEALYPHEIECNPDVLVIGAGIGGITAALTLAQENRNVYLIEKQPCIGGKTALFEALYPNLDCAACLLDPILNQVLHHDRIKILTHSELFETKGFWGHFTHKIKQNATYVDNQSCLGCGACSDVCPITMNNPYNQNLDQCKAIHIPYPGVLPNVAVIDKAHCLRLNGKECQACMEVCPFGAINYDDNDREIEITTGAVVVATGFDLFDPNKEPVYGYEKGGDIYTSLEFERILNTNGPTSGKIALKNGKTPKSIALIACAGSKTPKHIPYCSGICCTYLIKFADLISHKLPDTTIYFMYSDLCLPQPQDQSFFDQMVQDNRISCIRINNHNRFEIVDQGRTKTIRYQNHLSKSVSLDVDMAVLAPAMIPSKTSKPLHDILDLPADQNGFFMVPDQIFTPVATLVDGIYVVGCASHPMNIPTTIASAQAAAGNILSRLVTGRKISLEPTISVVDEKRCSGCGICLTICPYKAIEFNPDTDKVQINPVICRGCGTCAGSCPSQAILARHDSCQAICAQIKGCLLAS